MKTGSGPAAVWEYETSKNQCPQGREGAGSRAIPESEELWKKNAALAAKGEMRETSHENALRVRVDAFILFAILFCANKVVLGDSLSVQNLGVSEISFAKRSSFETEGPDFIELAAREWEGKNISAAELLSKEAGIQMQKLGGMGSFETISIRGASAKTVLICIDGIPLNDAGGGAISLGGIDLNQFEKIEIYKNYAPARFGGNAIGGVINFVSKTDAQNRNRILTSYGSHNSEELSYSISHKLIDNLKFSSEAGFRHSDNDYEFIDRNGTAYNTNDDTTRTRQNAEYTQISGTHTLKKLHGGGSFSTLSITHSNEWGGNPGKESNQTVVAGFDKSLFQTKYLWESPYTGNQQKQAGITGRIEKSTSHSYYPLDHIGYLYDSYLEYGTISYLARPEASFIYEPTKSPQKIHAGIHLYAEGELIEPRDNNEISSAYKWELKKIQGDIAGDFNISPIPFFTFGWDASARGSAYKKNRGVLYSPTSQDTLPETQKKNLFWASRTNVRIGKESFPLKGFASMAKYYRAPEMMELYGVREGVLSNPDLKAEKGINWEAGIRFEPNVFKNSFQLLYFETHAKNGIVWITSASFTKPINSEKSQTRGVEFEWESHYFNLFDYTFKGTIQNPRDRSQIAYYKNKYLTNEPVKTAHFALNFNLPLNIELSLEIHYRSCVFNDRANREKIPSETIFNASLAHTFTTKTRLVLAVNNIGNETYQNIYDSSPTPGREYKATLIQDF